MKKLVFACLTAMALSASADDAAIKGKWSMVAQQTETAKVTLGLDIGDIITVFNKTCEAAGQTINVIVEVATKITDGIFEIQGSAASTIKAGDLECTIEVKPEVLKYQVDQAHLTLTNAANQAFVFARVK